MDSPENSIFALAAQYCAEHRPFVLLTVVGVEGSTPAKPGAAMIVTTDGQCRGTIGGGQTEHQAIQKALAILGGEGASVKEKFELKDPGDLACGGSMEIFFDAHLFSRQVLIFGAGHVAEALCPILQGCGFSIAVYDERPERLALPAFRGARRVEGPFGAVSGEAGFSPETHVLVMTPDHSHDYEVVRQALEMPFKSLGLMASVNKRKGFLKRLLENGADQEKAGHINSPVGLNIGAVTPNEIAVSIAAQLIRFEADPEKLTKWPKSSLTE